MFVCVSWENWLQILLSQKHTQESLLHIFLSFLPSLKWDIILFTFSNGKRVDIAEFWGGSVCRIWSTDLGDVCLQLCGRSSQFLLPLCNRTRWSHSEMQVTVPGTFPGDPRAALNQRWPQKLVFLVPTSVPLTLERFGWWFGWVSFR